MTKFSTYYKICDKYLIYIIPFNTYNHPTNKRVFFTLF